MASERARKRAESLKTEACDCEANTNRKKSGQGSYKRFYCGGCLAAALDEARAEGADERLMQVIAALTDLELRPEDGGPVYYATYEFGGEVKTVAIHPRQIQPVFNALRRAVGGYEKLQEWRKRIEVEAEQRGAERERWECHLIAASESDYCGSGSEDFCPRCGSHIADAIAARGPMRGPEEE